MDKEKSKSVTQEKNKSKFDIEPGLKLLFVFFVFMGMGVERTGITLLTPLIFLVPAILIYKWGYAFGIKDTEKAKRGVEYLAIAGVFLVLWGFRVCC